MSDFGYKLAKKILKPIFYKKCDPTVLNAEVVPKEGPIVLCGNHMHVLDQCGPLFEIPRVVHYMAKKEYFDSFKTRWFFRMVGCISVDRENHEEAKKAKEKAISILKRVGRLVFSLRELEIRLMLSFYLLNMVLYQWLRKRMQRLFLLLLRVNMKKVVI